MPEPHVIGLRALNRALVERQLLTRERELAVPDAIERVVCLQGQEPPDAYFGLLARLPGFRVEQLADLFGQRRVVRTTLMRATIHLATPRDAAALRPLMQPVLDRELFGPWRALVQGMDVDAVVAAGIELVAERPLTGRQLGARLHERWPQHEAQALNYAVRCRAPLVQVPPRGVWGASHAPTLTTLEAWTGLPLEDPPSPETMIRRYLGAFGPAAVADVQAWSRLTGLRAVVERMRPELVSFRDERRRELFDLPDAPRPDANRRGPTRLLPQYDNALLSHADRSRIVAEEDRKRLTGGSAFLVDGFVRGTWRLERDGDRATLVVSPLRTLASAEFEALEEEGERVLQMAAPGADRRGVRVA